MNNSAALLRTLITWAICLPLALMIGYLLANQWDYSTWAFVGALAGLLALPILLRWHYEFMLLSWNSSAVFFFLKGAPKAALVMAVASFGFALLHRTINPQARFIKVPQITWPLIYLAAVVLFTAKLTGGFGLRMMGSDVYGGKKYIFTLAAIVAYFALTARRIPPERAGLALALFFLGGMTAIIGDFYYLFPSIPNFIFYVFPPGLQYADQELGAMRLGGAAALGSAMAFFLMARYGIRELFFTKKRWLLLVFLTFFALSLYGGHRATVVTIGGILLIQFFLEKLQRTKLLPIFLLLGLFVFALMVPLASHLPMTFQRALSFLPIEVNAQAKIDAQSSMEWRYSMWKALLPQVPEYLLLGKGYAFTAEDYEMMGVDSAFKSVNASQQGLALSGDYHSGWLSVLITFGIWGMIGTLWLFAAGIHVLIKNYRHGAPAIFAANCFLLADFIVRVLLFLSVSGGGLHSDLFYFLGDIGLSIALNGGVCRAPVVEKVLPATPVNPRRLSPRPQFQPAVRQFQG